MEKKMTVGVIGAGAISDIYIENMKNVFEVLEVKSVCSRRLERAQLKAAQHNLAACTLEEITHWKSTGHRRFWKRIRNTE
ncbi:MAG: hypothetical protein SPI87_12255 [Anaerobutyricum sp.]|nr:hypothetical protein [Anaerobutyricum sp.]